MPHQACSFSEFLADFGRRVLSGSDLDSLLSDAAAAVVHFLQVDLSSILELRPDGSGHFLAGVGWEEEDMHEATVELSGESAAGHVVRTLKPLAIDHSAAEPEFAMSPLLRKHQVVSSLLVPLIGISRPLGVLGAHSRRAREFSNDESVSLQLLGHFVAVRLAAKWERERQSDQRLLRAEQMMAIGQVAAGVAHELRNPLTSIKGLIQVNLRELRARGLPAEDLTIIEQEVRRMEKTLQTFLDFARPPQPHRRSTDLATIVDRVLALVGGRARKQGVTIRFIKPDSPVILDVDHDQIQQLLLNLVLNALDAMPRGGNIEVDLHAPHGKIVELYVRDTGPGIAPDILPKVFETFVSSKETGVGLGLPLSRRIAEDHGGSLVAYNLPDAGACFLLRLPAA